MAAARSGFVPVGEPDMKEGQRVVLTEPDI